MATFDEFFASLDLDEEGNVKKDKTEKGLPFEQIFVRWFLLNDPIWSSKVDRFLETGQDLGIDLVFKDKEGNKWAVQSKGYSPSTYITKGDIDSFISDSPTSEFYGRLLMASTDRIGTNADKTLKKNKVIRFLLKDFRNSSIDFPVNIKELSKVKKRKPFPRKNHQIEAINEVLRKIKHVDRGQVLMACGTGKTLTSLWIKEDFNAKQVLVLVPSLNLLSQTLNSWRSNLSDPFEWQCVCSDKTVHKQKDSEDEWINDPSELGIPVTSDTDEIKKFLRKKESRVIFSTYQSSSLIVEAQKDKTIKEFDIVFADEAHKCAGKVSEEFSCVLEEKKIRSKKRLFFTATARVLTKKIKNQAIKTETEVASMDDPKLFGEVLHTLKFSDAIKQGILTDYQVIVIGIDDLLIEEKIRNRNFIKTSKGEIIDSESLALQIALAKGIKENNLQTIINFHSRIEGAELFKDTFEKTIEEIPINERPKVKVSCDFVKGTMSTEKRNEKIQYLRKTNDNVIKILGNAKCLAEGVDVPSLDAITFVDPKSSEIDIVQAVGRVIRKDINAQANKKSTSSEKLGTIFIPIYLKNLEKIENQILESRFKDVWNVIKALKCHDDVLKENIDNLRVSLGKRRQKRVGHKGLQKVRLDLPTERISKEFINSISTILIRNTSDNWLENYGKLKYNHTNLLSSKISEEDPTLCTWIKNQRKLFNKGYLSKEKINLLNKLNFIWSEKEGIWMENYKQLELFFINNGHSDVKRKDQSKLASWCETQRKAYKILEDQTSNDKRNLIITKEQIDLLNKLNFTWDKIDEKWIENYEIYKEYVSKYGNLYPTEDHPILRRWCPQQRQRRKKLQISEKQIKLLDEINFIWDHKVIDSNSWMRSYTNLKNTKYGYKELAKKDPVLSRWVSKQRGKRKKDKLSEEQINLLDKINFLWIASKNGR